MGFFTRKQEVNLESFCRAYYDQHILTEEPNTQTTYCETIKHSITEIDPTFSNVDSSQFTAEMIAIRFELFALAWFHEFGDRLAINQSTFTKRYLQEKNMGIIWDNSEPYNQTISRSSTYGLDPTTPMGRAIIGTHDTALTNLFDKYHKQGIEPDCVVRAVSRESTDIVWKSGNTAKLLVCTLCDRLGLGSNEPNSEAQFRLVAVIQGFYNEVLEVLETIKVVS